VPAVVVNVVEALLVLLILAVAKWRGESTMLSRLAGAGYRGASGDGTAPGAPPASVSRAEARR
jgi:hypothetical protein